ncbi:DJ-1/PfpI family protein [Stenotrophomonas sp. TWI587]|jgi:putative intracellular protease/amidase|uniref:DJ-1/PfpI family protein n=1 Tax=Stenotrophomonas sp. TWI587 TaxID=3136783 RepID=UPI00320AA76E
MMLSLLRRTGAFLALLLAVPAVHARPAAADTVLIVVSGEGRDQGKTRPGFEMDEFAQAYLIFRDNGLAVQVASPRGGPVEADKFDPKEPFNARVLADPAATALLADTRATATLRAADYAAVYVVGGKGAMFDLPADAALRTVLGTLHDQGAVVAAVCHGPAALVDVRLADGSLLVAGRRMTGFTNAEEGVFGKRWAKEFPFLLETALRERGARWEQAPLMMPKLVVDGRLITGQNPYSTPAVAEAIVRATGRTPVARTPWRDEASMALVQRLLDGEGDAVKRELSSNRTGYHDQLIGVLGYYQLQAAQDDAAVRDALAIMQLAAPYMSEPQLPLGIARAHWRLGEVEQARSVLGKLLETHPDMAEAKQLKDTIEG